MENRHHPPAGRLIASAPEVQRRTNERADTTPRLHYPIDGSATLSGNCLIEDGNSYALAKKRRKFSCPDVTRHTPTGITVRHHGKGMGEGRPFDIGILRRRRAARSTPVDRHSARPARKIRVGVQIGGSGERPWCCGVTCNRRRSAIAGDQAIGDPRITFLIGMSVIQIPVRRLQQTIPCP